jgi:hypothetical protein
VPTLTEAAQRWQASRVDVAAATATQHRTALIDHCERGDALANRLARLAVSGELADKLRNVGRCDFVYAGAAAERR